MHYIVIILGSILVFFICSIVFAKLKLKGHFVSMKTKYIPPILTALLIGISFLFPVDSFFLTFFTPEQQLDYYMAESLDCVLQGEESAIGISFEEKALEVKFIKKHGFYWHPTFTDSTRFYYKKKPSNSIFLKNEYRIAIFSTAASNEKYIAVSFVSPDVSLVRDNNQSEFVHVEHNGEQEYAHSYVAFIGDFDETYCLFINGKTVTINNPVNGFLIEEQMTNQK